MLARPGSSSRSSVIVPGVTSRTTSRLTTDFGPSLARFRGVLDLLAHGHAMTQPDEPLQVIVGALDRHAAHGDVGSLVLAALGQHDAERPAGDLGVLEEELVEIAHSVEQEAVRVGRLDLHILRHHGRDAAGVRRRLGRRSGGRLRTRVEDGHGASLPERPRWSQRRAGAIPRRRCRRGGGDQACSVRAWTHLANFCARRSHRPPIQAFGQAFMCYKNRTIFGFRTIGQKN